MSTGKKIFLSHSKSDSELAHKINIALKAAGIDSWIDDFELEFGDELLKRIANTLQQTENFAILLTKTALSKSWVMTEIRMALTQEIEKGQPRVIALLMEDCEIPIELRHKLYLDFRNRFQAAINELADYIRGVSKEPLISRQMIISNMVRDANAELWNRLSAGIGKGGNWKQSEAADEIHELRSDELEAAVMIGSRWLGNEYKHWEGELTGLIQDTTNTSEAKAQRILKALILHGFLEEADDLDYRKEKNKAYTDTSLLWILKRAARRSGLFPFLPPPIPECLSKFLAHERSVDITSSGWFAIRYKEPVISALDPKQTVIAAIVRYKEPRTWAFRSADDIHPLKVNKTFTVTDLTPGDPFAVLRGEKDIELVEFDLPVFDDLNLLND